MTMIKSSLKVYQTAKAPSSSPRSELGYPKGSVSGESNGMGGKRLGSGGVEGDSEEFTYDEGQRTYPCTSVLTSIC